MKTQVLIIVIALCAFAASCGDSQQAPSVDPVRDTIPPIAKPTALKAPSGLTMYMRNMEEHYKTVRQQIKEIGMPDSTAFINFEGIYHVEPSPHVERDSTFHVYGDAWLASYEKMMKNTAPDSARQYFNASVDGCITCHQSFCPGPVVRIKKLQIAPMNR